MESWLAASLLGLIQGLTEFLPVSSSAHLILARDYFHWSLGSENLDLTFDVMLHLGTMLAVVAYFRKDIWRLLTGLFSSDPERRPDKKMAIYILLATIPAGLFGALFEQKIEDYFRSRVPVILIFLAVMGIVMWLADRYGKKARDEESVGFGDAMLIGIAQAAALMPGVSRSGGTITMGLFLGLNRASAARFSFLLSTPAVIGAGLWKLKDLRGMQLPPGAGLNMVIGVIVSAIVGFATIALLLRFLRERTVLVFTVYRVLLAVVLYFALVAR